jgi:phosphoglycolate phosphatase-like HAD superfamily hydrolase
MVNSMVSAVLFDLDGTILNCVEPMSREFIKIVQRLGVNITDEIRKRVGSNLGEILIKRSSPIAEFLLLWRLGRTIGLSFFKRVVLIFLSYSRLKNIANSSSLSTGF